MYPDVKAAGIDPFSHFETVGRFENRRGSFIFDPEFYSDIEFGADEDRKPSAIKAPIDYCRNYFSADVTRHGVWATEPGKDFSQSEFTYGSGSIFSDIGRPVSVPTRHGYECLRVIHDRRLNRWVTSNSLPLAMVISGIAPDARQTANSVSVQVNLEPTLVTRSHVP